MPISFQADSYRERILIPRDEAKKKKKEEEFLRFMGPAWKGKGDKLGGVSLVSLNIGHVF